MDDGVKAVMERCTRESLAGTITFPHVVRALAEAGVERYHADLQRAEKTYYLPGGESATVPSHRLETPPVAEFSAAGVEAALRSVQAGALTYRGFCERIAAAGCVGYVVSIAGRCAIYLGRKNEVFIEPFPAARR